MPTPPIERLMQMIAYQNETHDNPYMDDTPYRSEEEALKDVPYGYEDMIEYMPRDTAMRHWTHGPFGFNSKLPEHGYRIRPTSKQ